MTPYEIEELSEKYPDLLLADGFDVALIGVVHRANNPTLACYDKDMCIQILMTRDGMTHEEAEEFFGYNTLGAWMGQNTPCFLEKS